jgi:hypothetical protein
MTTFLRAATIAAMTFCLGGMISNSSAGRAAELDRPAIITSPVHNATVPTVVPEILSPETLAIAASEAVPILVPEAPKPMPATFDTLGEAVAAQEVAGADEALRCLATTVFFESKGEPLAGQLAVAHVVINRTKSGRFAPDICGVVKQRGQFSFVRRGVLPTVDAANRMYRTALAVAKVAVADAWKSPAPNALFFNGRRVGLPGRLTKVAFIGNHVFYR